MIVADASVVVYALAFSGAESEVSRSRLEDHDIHVPHLLGVEVVSALRRGRMSGALDEQQVEAALRDLSSLPAQRYPHEGYLEEIWRLRQNVTAYDAAYAALAGLLGCPLVTWDGRLARAPRLPCDVEVLRAEG